MLILEQRLRERITITHEGETLVILLQKIQRRQDGDHSLKIGFEGPRSFEIVRDSAGKRD